jgi:hypothetical protein
MSDTTCRYCREAVRRDGLQWIANSDDSVGCPDAPMDTCSRCAGKGCNACEQWGVVYSRHIVRETAKPAAGTAMVQHTRTEVMHLVMAEQLQYGTNGTALCGRSTRFMDDTGVRDQSLTLGHPAGHCAECWQHIAYGLA